MDDAVGNYYADAFAGRAAKRVEVSPDDVSRVERKDREVEAILDRIVAINPEAANRPVDRSRVTVREPGLSLAQRFAADRQIALARLQAAHATTQHSVVFHTGEHRCSRCFQAGSGPSAMHASRVLTRASLDFARWLESPCSPLASASRRGFQPLRKEVHVGGHTLHPTHALAYRRGIIFCLACGGTAMAKPVTLLGPCDRCRLPDGSVPKSRRYQLNRLLKGLTPQPGITWPVDEGPGPPGILEFVPTGIGAPRVASPPVPPDMPVGERPPPEPPPVPASELATPPGGSDSD